ncbi:hypothetical protein [Parvicella tangerina]|uniref:Uncharacterized protein n=1 Tax=Parvicella tangerina TaxID=2829795 RepID=A0A916JNW8_9FLAO|nr:hypothetical protein [Parvicella tangerina]CAG5082995.1 hypothetical protein CRYO30217_02063 [Parvicella tangerina]
MTHLKSEVISLRLSEADKKKLAWLSERTVGSMSATIRLLVINAYRELNNKKTLPIQAREK